MKFRRAASACLVALMFLLATASSAYAEATITDRAGVLNASDIASAAGDVENVNVVVVTLRTDADDPKAAVQAIGPAGGWEGSDWASNSVILVVDVQARKLAVYYGSTAGEKLGQHPVDIENAMADRFSQAQWTQGMLDGIKQIDDAVDPSYGVLWVFLAVAIAVALYFAYRGYRKYRQAQEDKKLRIQIAAENQLTAVQLRQRVDDLLLLAQTVPLGARQQQLAADLNDVEVALDQRDGRMATETPKTAPVPQDERKALAPLVSTINRVTDSLTLLRQDSGWIDLWEAAIAGSRDRAQRLEHLQASLSDRPDYFAVDIPAVQKKINALLPAVLEGSRTVDAGVEALDALDSQVGAKRAQVDTILAQIADTEQAELDAELARTSAEDARREAEENQQDDPPSSDGGIFGGGWSTGGRRRSGGNWGGGSRSGGGTRGSGSSGGRSSSGGGRSGGVSGGGRSRGFSGGDGQRGGGRSRGF